MSLGLDSRLVCSKAAQTIDRLDRPRCFRISQYSIFLSPPQGNQETGGRKILRLLNVSQLYHHRVSNIRVVQVWWTPHQQMLNNLMGTKKIHSATHINNTLLNQQPPLPRATTSPFSSRHNQLSISILIKAHNSASPFSSQHTQLSITILFTTHSTQQPQSPSTTLLLPRYIVVQPRRRNIRNPLEPSSAQANQTPPSNYEPLSHSAHTLHRRCFRMAMSSAAGHPEAWKKRGDCPPPHKKNKLRLVMTTLPFDKRPPQDPPVLLRIAIACLASYRRWGGGGGVNGCCCDLYRWGE